MILFKFYQHVIQVGYLPNVVGFYGETLTSNMNISKGNIIYSTAKPIFAFKATILVRED